MDLCSEPRILALWGLMPFICFDFLGDVRVWRFKVPGGLTRCKVRVLVLASGSRAKQLD